MLGGGRWEIRSEILCSLLRSLSLYVVIGSSLKHTQIILLLTHLLQQSGQRGPYSVWDTGWAAKGLWFDSRQRKEFLIFSKSPTPAGLPFKEATFQSVFTYSLPHLFTSCVSHLFILAPGALVESSLILTHISKGTA
jgi:hypothetical protein